ncbi:paralemmin-1 isoform X2 [Leucoraja erinacea]|nr:paralemmin-1 isoform X2 [Leucoraja erinacea]XP_055497464.1 paralemmin-1 isoform X2 [Leucoraja erinacea]XP_055497465.1 paralemmin-1 isoform X2 [Leucoraja erinacea]
MEETHLLKERLQAITEKRKIQEKITGQRFEVEEEKLKLKHLKSKALRERWLLEGVANLTPQEQEAIRTQHQEDQLQSKQMEQTILRLEGEIKSLENQETQISYNEQLLLKKLKATERSTADIIKAAHAESDQDRMKFVNSEILNPANQYQSQKPQRTINPDDERQDPEQSKAALFAVEINVQRDMKTGESTVLSTVPVTVDEMRNSGVKVYEDGTKSVYALCSGDGLVQNGINAMTHEEVEALLQKAGEKQDSVPAACHSPVYSSPYSSPHYPNMIINERVEPEARIQENTIEGGRIEMHNPVKAQIYRSNDTDVTQEKILPCYAQAMLTPAPSLSSPMPNFWSPRSTQTLSRQSCESPLNENQVNSMHLPYHQPRDNHRQAVFMNSELNHNGRHSSASEETDIGYNICHSLPSTVNTEEPVTMVFMGYHNVDDENETSKVLGFEGAIRAELVMISDDEEEVAPIQANSHTDPVFHPATLSTENETHKTSYAAITLTAGNNSLPRKSVLISGQDKNNSPFRNHSDGHLDKDGIHSDATVSALGTKMAILGKTVMM